MSPQKESVTEPQTDDNWIQTYSGRQFWPLNPLVDDVCIEDIAHALSLKCRFSGHTKRFYSVAQHSLIVSRIVPEQHALWGLLHDAAEAYMPDVARPIKRLLPDLRDMDDRLTNVIAQRFGLQLPIPDEVHNADLILLATEHRDLMSRSPKPWTAIENVRCLTGWITPWAAEWTEKEFLARFAEYSHKETS